MRLKITFRCLSPKLVPINYNHFLAGALYGKIKRSDPDYAFRIHSSCGYKFYTFSWLMCEDRKIKSNCIEFKGRVVLYVSSPEYNLITRIVEGLVEEPFLRIKKSVLDVDQIEILPLPNFSGEHVFATLSPIIVRSVKLVNGERKPFELYPNDSKFYENLKRNLQRKYQSFYGSPALGDFEIVKILSFEPKRIKVKDTYHRCSLMRFRVHGSPELLKFAYEAGLGEKNAMGFGMVKLTE